MLKRSVSEMFYNERKAGYAVIVSVSRCKKNVKCVNIPLHTLRHFREILIFCQKPSTFHQEIATLSENYVK